MREATDEIRRLHVGPKVRVLDRPRIFEIVPVTPAARTLEQAVVAVARVGADEVLQRFVAEALNVERARDCSPARAPGGFQEPFPSG